MKPAAIRKLCLSLPGAAESIQWGGERVFKVGGKMFAVISAARDADAMSFKTSDESSRLLTELPGLSPAPYLARAKWVRIAPLSSLPPADLAAYLRRAHELVVAALPKKTREGLATNRTASATSPARRASRGLSGTSARSGTSRPRRSP